MCRAFRHSSTLRRTPGQRRVPALGDDALLPTPQLPLNVSDLGERLEPVRWHREQIRMLGRNQGADHVIGPAMHCRNIVLAIIAFVEDPGDV